MLLPCGKMSYATHFDPFMRNYLTIKTGEIPNMRDIYTTFKEYVSKSKLCTEDIVKDLHDFSSYFCAIALGKEKDTQLRRVFSDLRELRVDVAYPLLLELYHEYKNGNLKHEELVDISRMVESYVFRRTICSMPTNSLNKTFASLLRSIDKNKILESLTASMMLMPSYRRFPTDEEFSHHIKSRDVYNFRNRSYLLRRLENHGKKEFISIDNYTIENIMPQNENLSSEWIAELGENWKETHQTLLHTLGNLTLTGYNSEYSDHAFSFKRSGVKNKDNEHIGLQHSPLTMNQGFSEVKKWNAASISARAQKLCTRALSIWNKPPVDKNTLIKYQSKPNKGTVEYTINDHPHLLKSDISALFAVIRKEIKDLDECVTEEFLKPYVAYKAETNFVDIIPQAKKLVIILNLNVDNLEDPINICEDISGIGHWGNGNVRTYVRNHGDIPNVMNLIRQSYEINICD